MNKIINITSGAALTMSSKDIAELCDKRHDNVVRDARKMLVELHGEEHVLKFEGTINRPNPKGGACISSPILNLPKRECLILVSGYSVELRARIIDRWMELENGITKFEIPQTFAEALRLAAEQTEKLEKQAVAIAEMQPKADFHDDVAAAINAQDYQAVAKVLGTGRTRFTRWLKAKKITMENLRPYQQYEDAGYFRVDERKRKDPVTGESIIYTKTLVTGKGVIYLQKKWNEDKNLGGTV